MQVKKVHPIFPVLLWIFVALLGAELVAKWFYLRSKGAYDKYDNNWDLRKVTECFHPLLWSEPWVEYKPGSKAFIDIDGKTYKATINRIGFRGKDYTLSPDHHAIRIACFGGSTTVNGETDDQTYPALLERFLSQNGENPSVRVMNCGVAGMDSSGYHRSLERLINSNALPDLVVEYNAINSICWKLFPYWRAQLNPLQRLLLRSRFVDYVFGRFLIPSEHQIRQDIQDFCISNLRDFQTELHDRGIHFCVASFISPDPDLGTPEMRAYLDYDTRYWWHSEYISYRELFRIVQIYNQELKNFADETGTDYLPLSEWADMGPDSFQDICHMQPEGIESKAFVLSRLVEPVLNHMRNVATAEVR